MRRFALGLLVVVPALALADDADPWPAAPPPARLVAVHGALDGWIATLAIRYELDVAGPRLWRTSYRLAVPPGGVVTGATVQVAGVAHVLALGAAKQLAGTLDALGSADGGARDRGWAFSITEGEMLVDAVGLDVAAPRNAHVVVDLAISVPACYLDEARYVKIEPTWMPHVDRTLCAASSPALETACGNPLEASSGWLRFADREPASQPSPRIVISRDRLVLSSTAIARVELDVAAMLADVPSDLYTAIVVDNSRSVSDRARWEQRAIVASYLGKAPTGHVQVIAYDRHARALLPAWSVASAARTKIVKSLDGLDAANGSNLDAGLAEAVRWLDGMPGTHRVIVFTDELLPWRVKVDRLAVPAGTLVHAVALSGGDAMLERYDRSLLAAFAAKTEGVGFVTGGGTHAVDATVLVRPIAFEHARVTAPGWTPITIDDMGACTDDETLAEGDGCAWWARGSGSIHVTGRLWNHAVDREIALDDTHALALARTLAAPLSNLDDTLRPEVERIARAVDSVWSLVASWGGTGGYAGHVVDGLGDGRYGCGCDGPGAGAGYGSAAMPTVQMGTLTDQLARAVSHCALRDTRVALDVELTDDEIVDVAVSAPADLTACVTDAVWAAPIALARRGHRLEHVELP